MRHSKYYREFLTKGGKSLSEKSGPEHSFIKYECTNASMIEES